MTAVNENLYRDQSMHPGYRRWLKTARKFHTDDYGEFLDAVADSVGNDTLRLGQASSLIPGEYWHRISSRLSDVRLDIGPTLRRRTITQIRS